jgi:protein-S-isoprenylcysteine O-methyltransferase Ste14
VAGQVGLLGVIAGALWLTGAGWGTWSIAAGLLLGAAGAVLAAWGLLALGENLSPYPEPKQGVTLVDRGPFRLVRHPVYGGIVIGAIGAGLFAGSWPALTAAGALTMLLLGKSRFEEQQLVERLSGYAAYRDRVRRVMIPWVL